MFAQSIRPPAVAGLFYEADPHRLQADVSSLLAAVPVSVLKAKVLMVPHAGYIYSGQVAATAYRTLEPRADAIKRVILLGPTHRVPVLGMAVPSVAGFSSPLGVVPLDREAIDDILTLPQVMQGDRPHQMEHSLEVHLPFLQTVLKDFKLVPIAVGQASAHEVMAVLERLWGGDETLILVSSDLSHFHTYEEAKKIDAHAVEQILALQSSLDHEQACGATPLNGLLLLARKKGMKARLLDVRNSGDTAGDRDQVVGYASIGFTLDDDHAQ